MSGEFCGMDGCTCPDPEPARSVPSPADPPCRGFQWIGQSFASCNECGQPYWAHDYDTRMKPEAGPFDEDPFDYVPITSEQKAACRLKWERE